MTVHISCHQQTHDHFMRYFPHKKTQPPVNSNSLPSSYLHVLPSCCQKETKHSHRGRCWSRYKYLNICRQSNQRSFLQKWKHYPNCPNRLKPSSDLSRSPNIHLLTYIHPLKWRHVIIPTKPSSQYYVDTLGFCASEKGERRLRFYETTDHLINICLL